MVGTARRRAFAHPTIEIISIMVRVLMADDFVELFRPVILQRGLARQVDDGADPAEPGLGSVLQGRHHPIRPVERAGHDLDLGAADTAEAQRRAAARAKVTLSNRGGTERRWLAAG